MLGFKEMGLEMKNARNVRHSSTSMVLIECFQIIFLLRSVIEIKEYAN